MKSVRVAVLAVMIGLALSASVEARGLGLFRSSSNFSSYYYPVYSAYYVAPAPVVTYYYVAPALEVVPTAVPCEPAPALAQPTPAPPSATAQKPRVQESSTGFYQAYSGEGAKTPNRQSCQVGFWNLTGRDITVEVAGRSYILRRGETLTIQAPRRFVWRYDNGPAHAETVPADRNEFEIVIRR